MVVLQRSSRKISTSWLVLGRTSSLRCYCSHSINLKIYCMSFKGGSCLKAAATHRFCGRLLSRWCFVRIPFTALYRESGLLCPHMFVCDFACERVNVCFGWTWVCVYVYKWGTSEEPCWWSVFIRPPEAQISIVLRCWNKGDYKWIDLATLNRFSFKALPQAPSVFQSPHTHSHTHIKHIEQI